MDHSNIPDSILIGIYEYKVKLVDEVYNSKGDKAYGQVNYAKHHILLDKNNTPDRMKAVLWHEIFHAVIEACGFVDGETLEEENLILRTSPVFAQIVRDNKELRDYYAE